MTPGFIILAGFCLPHKMSKIPSNVLFYILWKCTKFQLIQTTFIFIISFKVLLKLKYSNIQLSVVNSCRKLSEWAEFLWVFTIFKIKNLLKISAIYLFHEKSKSLPDLYNQESRWFDPLDYNAGLWNFFIKVKTLKKISHLLWQNSCFYSVSSKQRGSFSNFCGLFRKAGL